VDIQGLPEELLERALHCQSEIEEADDDAVPTGDEW